MENLGLTGMIPFTYFDGYQKMVGSTFLRIDCLTSCVNDFEKWMHGKKYDNLIFQKTYWKEMMELFKGPKILDICDPDWLIQNINLREIVNLVHGITCSSEGLTELLKKYFPDKLIVHVPDRLNPNIFPKPRNAHIGVAKKLVWFGFIHNAYASLAKLLPSIKKYNLELKIISNKPYEKEDEIFELNPEFILYEQETAYNYIKEADIVLNPLSDMAYYKYKSKNKSLISWKLGVPVAVSNEDIERFMNPKQRNNEVEIKQKLINENYLIEKSIEQYRKIISDIRNNIL